MARVSDAVNSIGATGARPPVPSEDDRLRRHEDSPTGLKLNH